MVWKTRDPSTWNMFKKERRTNNAAESFNSALNKKGIYNYILTHNFFRIQIPNILEEIFYVLQKLP